VTTRVKTKTLKVENKSVRFARYLILIENNQAAL
jgi:hypothetical protein